MQTNAFTIEKNVPLPSGISHYTRYPFADMQVGDSFVVPIDQQKKVACAAVSYANRHGRKFATRKIDAETCRVWRVA